MILRWFYKKLADFGRGDSAKSCTSWAEPKSQLIYFKVINHRWYSITGHYNKVLTSCVLWVGVFTYLVITTFDFSGDALPPGYLFYCNSCPKTFSDIKTVRKHCGSVHKYAELYVTHLKLFPCSYCYYVASSKKGFLNHRELHLKDAKHRCHRCHYLAVDRKGLVRHLKISGCKNSAEASAQLRQSQGIYFIYRHVIQLLSVLQQCFSYS